MLWNPPFLSKTHKHFHPSASQTHTKLHFDGVVRQITLVDLEYKIEMKNFQFS